MRRLILAAAVLSGAACASPAPCTQALCPLRFNGSYRVSGWTTPVTVTQGVPAIPVVSDSTVEILSGRAEFVNRRAVLRASEGASFRFSVSSDDAHVPAVVVVTGEVSVALSSTSAPSPVPPGTAYLFPAPKK
jgi:hypothetical protein